jgi:hypothetical protein
MLATLLTCACLVFAGGGEDPPPDTIQLTKGKPIQGIVLRSDENGVWLAQKSRIKHFELTEVVSMSGPRVIYPEYLDKMRAEFREPPDAERSTAMGNWCRENGLLRDADIYFWRALLDDTNYGPAHEALGHRKNRGIYQIPVKGKGKMDFQELREYHGSHFQDGWQITTAHFDIQASCDLPDILNACADLEQMYQAYFQAFQSIVGFWEIRDPMRVQIYPTRDDMPPLSGTIGAYFKNDTRTLYCYFKDGVAEGLMHESVHAITHGSIREFARNDPAVPGWFWEGTANYFAKGMSGNPGDRTFIPNRPHMEFFETQREHDNPDSIQRVMNYQSSDFMASTGQKLKYAESYTLMYYLLNSDDPEMLEKCHTFIASVYERKGSSTHFKKIMGIRKWDDFQDDWWDYIQKVKIEEQEEKK